MSMQRIDYLDWAKGFCILAIVLMHASSVLNMDLSRKMHLEIATQMFFFLSGIVFNGNMDFKTFLLRKTGSLLVPFAFFYIVGSIVLPNILYAIGYNVRNADAIGIASLYAFARVPHAVFPNGPVWFLLCLFAVNVLFYGISRLAESLSGILNHKFIAVAVIIFLCCGCGISGYELGKHGIGLYLYIDTALSVLPFFGVGYVLKKYTPVFDMNISKWLLVSVMLGCGWVVYRFATPISCISNVYEGTFGCVYGTGLAGMIAVMCLSRLCDKVPAVMLYFGRYSLIILCTHQLIIHFSLLFVNKLPFDNWLRCIMVFAFVILAEIVLIPVMNRFFPHVTALKNIFKKEND